jgi:hypothetical protein
VADVLADELDKLGSNNRKEQSKGFNPEDQYRYD